MVPANSEEAWDDDKCFHLLISYHVPGTVVWAFDILSNYHNNNPLRQVSFISVISQLMKCKHRFIGKYRAWQTMVLGSNTALKFSWTSIPFHWHRVWGCSWATVAESTVRIDSLGPRKPKRVTIWPFIAKVHQSIVQNMANSLIRKKKEDKNIWTA